MAAAHLYRMTTQPHEFQQPRDVKGRFGVVPRAEDDNVNLHVVAADSAVERHMEIYRASAIAQGLVAWHNGDGKFAPIVDTEAVEHALRDQVAPNVSDEDFAAHLSDIRAAAADCNVLEGAATDPSETESWVPTAEKVDVYTYDYPVPSGDWSVGDATCDYESYREGAAEAASERLHASVSALVDAERATHRPH